MKTLLTLLGSTLLAFNASAFSVLMFWDANGVAPGSGSSAPTGTWGVDAYWNEDASGGTGPYGTNLVTKPWGDGSFAVFAAGNDAGGDYTILVSNTVKVADIHVDLGSVTFNPAPGTTGAFQMVMWENLQLTNNINRLLSAGHKTDNAVAHYNVPLNGARGIIRYKRGTIILAATNLYTGDTTIEGGILQLGASHVLPASTRLVLANNDPARPDFNEVWRYTPAVLAADGKSQNFGPLALTGTDASVERRLDFGDGSSTLSFANSSAEDWGGFTLTLVNFTRGADFLRFGNNAVGLTEPQLSQMRFANFSNLPGRIDTQGYVTPAWPILLQPVRTGTVSVELAWTAVAGRTYRAQYKTNINSPDWTDIIPDVLAEGSTASVTDWSAAAGTRFYRVAMLP